VVVWLGIGVSYFSVYPSGFYITTFGFAAYLMAVAFRQLWDRFGWQRSLPPVRVALPA
jgi:zinc/manganese transport system permease protein